MINFTTKKCCFNRALPPTFSNLGKVDFPMKTLLANLNMTIATIRINYYNFFSENILSFYINWQFKLFFWQKDNIFFDLSICLGAMIINILNFSLSFK